MRRNNWADIQDTPRVVNGIEYWHTYKVSTTYDYNPEYIQRLWREKTIGGIKIKDSGQGGQGGWLWIDIESFREYLNRKGGIMRDPAWITVYEAEALVHYARRTIVKWIESGKLDGRLAIAPDSHSEVWYVKRDDIIAFTTGRDNPIHLEGDLGAALWNTFGHLLGGKRGN